MQGAECIENGELENGLRRMRTKHWEEKASLMGTDAFSNQRRLQERWEIYSHSLGDEPC